MTFIWRVEVERSLVGEKRVEILPCPRFPPVHAPSFCGVTRHANNSTSLPSFLPSFSLFFVPVYRRFGRLSMNFLSLPIPSPPFQLYLRVFGPSTSVPGSAWQVLQQFATRIIALLPRTQWVCLGHNVESNGIAADFSPRFSGKKGRGISPLSLSLSFSWLAREGTAGLAASLASRILSFAKSAALSRRLFAEFPGMRLEVVPFGYSSGLDPRVSRRVLARWRVSLRPTAG